jgi:hypothetical protein
MMSFLSERRLEMPKAALARQCAFFESKVISEDSWHGVIDRAPTNSDQSYILGNVSPIAS